MIRQEHKFSKIRRMVWKRSGICAAALLLSATLVMTGCKKSDDAGEDSTAESTEEGAEGSTEGSTESAEGSTEDAAQDSTDGKAQDGETSGDDGESSDQDPDSASSESTEADAEENKDAGQDTAASEDGSDGSTEDAEAAGSEDQSGDGSTEDAGDGSTEITAEPVEAKDGTSARQGVDIVPQQYHPDYMDGTFKQSIHGIPYRIPARWEYQRHSGSGDTKNYKINSDGLFYVHYVDDAGMDSADFYHEYINNLEANTTVTNAQTRDLYLGEFSGLEATYTQDVGGQIYDVDMCVIPVGNQDYLTFGTYLLPNAQKDYYDDIKYVMKTMNLKGAETAIIAGGGSSTGSVSSSSAADAASDGQVAITLDGMGRNGGSDDSSSSISPDAQRGSGVQAASQSSGQAEGGL